LKLEILRGVVLSGGQSRRMGRDKARLNHKGVTFLENSINLIKKVTDSVVVSGREDQLAGLSLEGIILVEDIIPGIGPLGGIYSAMTIPAERYLIAAVDMPFISPELLGQMVASKGNAVACHNGRLQPVCCLLERQLVPLMDEQINRGDFSIMSLLRRIKFSTIEAGSAEEVRDIDTPEDKNKYLR
jgi:molybdopterin-guanine dinucleotide biosynthesis protein A